MGANPQLVELLRPFREDLTYYAPRCLKIRTKSGDIRPLVFNTAQLAVHRALQEQIRVKGMVRALVLKGRQQGMCLDPETLVMTDEFDWVPLRSVKVGTRLIGIDEEPLPDPVIERPRRRMRLAVVERVWTTKRLAYEITLADGRTLTCSGEHRWLSRKSLRKAEWRSINGGGRANNGLDRLKPGDELRIAATPWKDIDTIDQAWALGVRKGNWGRDFGLPPDGWVGRYMPHAGWQEIVSIKALDERDLIDLQTSCGTFFANGVVSHNSTYVEARYYHHVSGQIGKRAYILTHEQTATDGIFAMAKRYHDLCPEVLQPHTKAANAKELFFDLLDSGYEVATAGTRNTGRSKTVQYMHGSEVAFWEHAADHLAGIGQSVPNEPGTEIILESTANGVGNVFHAMWTDAERGRGDYIPIFIPWFWQNEYRRKAEEFVAEPEELDYADKYGLDMEQLAWRRAKIETDFRGDVALFNQEYPAEPLLAFQRAAGYPLIQLDLVIKARETRGKSFVGNEDYTKIMGLDPAEYGDDDSVLMSRIGRVAGQVYRRWSGRGPMELVGLVAREADAFDPFAINVDCTGVGSGVADRLIELGYPVTRVHFGERPVQQALYVLRRDELWGDMKVWFEDQPNMIPDDDALAFDLTGPQYTYDSSRRMKLERKEDMKKRGIKSPDAGDALALTFATPSGIVNAVEFKRKRARPANWRAA